MEDVKQILTECSKKYPHTAVCCDTIVTSDKFIQKWNEPFKDLVIKKAEMVRIENELTSFGFIKNTHG